MILKTAEVKAKDDEIPLIVVVETATSEADALEIGTKADEQKQYETQEQRREEEPEVSQEMSGETALEELALDDSVNKEEADVNEKVVDQKGVEAPEKDTDTVVQDESVSQNGLAKEEDATKERESQDESAAQIAVSQEDGTAPQVAKGAVEEEAVANELPVQEVALLKEVAQEEVSFLKEVTEKESESAAQKDNSAQEEISPDHTALEEIGREDQSQGERGTKEELGEGKIVDQEKS